MHEFMPVFFCRQEGRVVQQKMSPFCYFRLGEIGVGLVQNEELFR